jgi:hypothetical protein
MANIKLGSRPKTFKPFKVKFDLPEGGEGAIEVTYKYRSKTEFGRHLDDMMGQAKSKEADEPRSTENFSMEAFFKANTAASADHLMGSIDAWDLDEPLTRDALLQLGDECPAAVAALIACYANACRDGRLGN